MHWIAGDIVDDVILFELEVRRSEILGGCPFNGRLLSGMKYPTRESPPRDDTSPIKYNYRSTMAYCHNGGTIYRSTMKENFGICLNSDGPLPQRWLHLPLVVLLLLFCFFV